MVVFFVLIPHSHAKNTVLISINNPVWVQHLSGSLCSCLFECMTLQGQLKRLNRERSRRKRSSWVSNTLGAFGKTMCVSVVTLIMQGLCDAISKREEKFK